MAEVDGVTGKERQQRSWGMRSGKFSGEGARLEGKRRAGNR